MENYFKYLCFIAVGSLERMAAMFMRDRADFHVQNFKSNVYVLLIEENIRNIIIKEKV